jgi:hypothetical protein
MTLTWTAGICLDSDNRMTSPQRAYEVRPRKDKRGVDLMSDALPFGRLWYDGPNAVANAMGYAEYRSRSHDAAIRVFDEAGNVVETHEPRGQSRHSMCPSGSIVHRRPG